MDEFLDTGDAIMAGFLELRRLLSENEQVKAEQTFAIVVEKAKALHDYGIRLRARSPRLSEDELVALDRVYESIASILNNAGGDIFVVANTIGAAKIKLGR